MTIVGKLKISPHVEKFQNNCWGFIAIYAVLLLNLLLALFCREIFATIYALSCGENTSPKVHLWRKMTNIRSGDGCSDQNCFKTAPYISLDPAQWISKVSIFMAVSMYPIRNWLLSRLPKRITRQEDIRYHPLFNMEIQFCKVVFPLQSLFLVTGKK